MVYSTVRAPGKEHMLSTPRGFIVIRYIQLVLAVILLGLDAYGLYMLPFSGAALNMFTIIATLIVTIYNIVAAKGPATIYNYWAILSLDIFLVVFWLCSFALMAAEVAPFMAEIAYSGSSYGYYYSSSYYYSDTTIAFAACMAAVAGLGGLQFLLFIVSLAMTSVFIHRHRAAGLHCMPGAHSEKPPGGVVYAAAPIPAPAPAYGAPMPAGPYPHPHPQQPQFPQQQPQFHPHPAHQSMYGMPPPQQQQSMSPAPGMQHMYGAPTPPPQMVHPAGASPPLAQPTPYYPAQAQAQQAPSPLQPQLTGPLQPQHTGGGGPPPGFPPPAQLDARTPVQQPAELHQPGPGGYGAAPQ